MALLFAGLAAPPAAAAERLPTSAARDFRDSIGINIHMAYTDTAYGDVARVQQALSFIGVRNVRNLLQSATRDPAGQVHLRRLAATCSCRFDFVATDPRQDAALAWLNGFAADFPGRILAVEGPNEVDHRPVSFSGLRGRDAAVAYQRALYGAVHADPAMAGVPVFGLTGLGASWHDDLSDIMDYGNEHPYARGGAPPALHLLKEIADTSRAVAPRRPMVVTESGYPTLPARPDIPLGRDGVSENVQARYTLALLFDFWKAGVARTFLYELLDEKPDPDGRAVERHYGLFHFDGTPKAAAVALHNLSTVLDESGPDVATARPLLVSVAHLPIGGNALVLTAPGGIRFVILWAEPIDPAIPGGTSHAVTVTLDRPAAAIGLYDPMASADRLRVLPAGTSAVFSLEDRPLILKVAPRQ